MISGVHSGILKSHEIIVISRRLNNFIVVVFHRIRKSPINQRTRFAA